MKIDSAVFALNIYFGLYMFNIYVLVNIACLMLNDRLNLILFI